MDELNCKYKGLNIKIKTIKNKLNRFPVGTVININGNKKIYKGKIEKTIDKIKKMEEEYNEYIQSQLSWARNILKNDIEDDKLIKILDIFNKLIDNKQSSSSDSENEFSDIYKDIKILKINEMKKYINIGNTFINKNINSKKDLSSEDLLFIKEIIKTSDIKSGSKDDKINRFINTCKRYSIISQKLPNDNNIFQNKCKTSIRDISNKEFDNLLKLLENKK
jgi:hypothetical protein